MYKAREHKIVFLESTFVRIRYKVIVIFAVSSALVGCGGGKQAIPCCVEDVCSQPTGYWVINGNNVAIPCMVYNKVLTQVGSTSSSGNVCTAATATLLCN